MLALQGLLLISLLQGAEQKYEYLRNPNELVGIKRGTKFSIGKLDDAGNFRHDKEWLSLDIGIDKPSLPEFRFLNKEEAREVYEFRKKRLIPGSIDKNGSFIPDLGGKVIALEEYLKNYKPDDKSVRRIYNLPGKIIREGGKGLDKK